MTSFFIETVDENSGKLLTGSLNLIEPPAPQKMRIGVDFPAAELAANLNDFPYMRYHRHFGTDHDKDKLPELPNVATDKKWLELVRDCLIHQSWKDDINQLTAWATTPRRPYVLTWKHEPHGDITPEEYRPQAEKIPGMLASSGNGQLCLYHGPAVTRYWVQEGGGSFQAYWYKGATALVLDAYNGQPGQINRYRSAGEMFDDALEFCESMEVPLIVAEFGAELVDSDIKRDAAGNIIWYQTGIGRAQFIRDCIAHLNGVTTVPVIGMGYWNTMDTKLAPEDAHGRATLRTAIWMQHAED